MNDITYKKVIKHGTKTFNWMDAPPVPPGCDTSYTFSGFSALVREEGKKIYTCASSGQDTLLYDFDLEEGDYLPLTWNQNVEEVMVLAVDSMLVDGNYRKVFELEEYYGQSNNLIEGIGFESGFLESFSNWEFPAALQCFAKSGTTYYPEYNAPCDLSVSVQPVHPDKEIIAYPHPVNNTLTLETKNAEHVNRIIAFDALGQQNNLPFTIINNSKIQVDCSSLNTGFQFVKVSLEDGKKNILEILKR